MEPCFVRLTYEWSTTQCTLSDKNWRKMEEVVEFTESFDLEFIISIGKPHSIMVDVCSSKLFHQKAVSSRSCCFITLPCTTSEEILILTTWSSNVGVGLDLSILIYFTTSDVPYQLIYFTCLALHKGHVYHLIFLSPKSTTPVKWSLFHLRTTS